MLLAALIQCEAGEEPYEGQVAVGAVVMNRVRSGAYPNTVKGVIYASGQFTPAGSGQVGRVVASGKIKLPAGGTGSDGGKHPGWNSDAF